MGTRVRPGPAPASSSFFVTAVALLLASLLAVGQEAKPGAIRGSVEDGAGRPLSQVTVSLRDSNDQILATVQTDDNGSFQFLRLATGKFAVAASRAGYGRTVYGATEAGAPAQLIDISLTQPETRIRMPMWKNASISGRVVDSSGESLVGARVEAARLEIRGGVRQFVSNRLATTDDRGNYRLVDLIPGTYAAILPAPSAADAEVHYSTTYFPNVTSAESAVFIPLGKAEERQGLDFVAGLARSFSVSGAIDGVPQNLRSPLRITLRPRGATGLGDLIRARTVPLDDAGRFKFDGVVPGRYVAEVIDAHFDPSETESKGSMMSFGPGIDFDKALNALDRLDSLRGLRQSPIAGASSNPPLADPPRMRWARLEITVEDQNVDGLIGRFESGSTIAGKVVFAGDSPKPSAETLAATPIYPSAVFAPIQTLVSGMAANGTFRTIGVTPGRYEVLVVGRFPGWTLVSISQDGRDLPAGLVDVDRTDVNELVFTYTDRPSTLRGVVSDSSGKALEGALVYVFPANSERWAVSSMLSSGSFRQVRTTSGGRFSVTMSPGQYAVAATIGYVPDWKALENLEGLLRRSQRVRLTAGETATTDLKVVK
jgi:protocatechuate 3,4-dioxygenase beta subunit